MADLLTRESPKSVAAPDGRQDNDAPRTTSERRRRLFLLAAVGLLIAGTWSVLAFRTVDGARAEARLGRDKLMAAEGLSLSAVTDGTMRTELTAARSHLVAAQNEMGSLWVKPAQWVPLLRTQVRSASALNDAGLRTLDVGIEGATKAEALLATPPSTGPDRVAMLNDIDLVLDKTRNDISSLDLGPTTGLLAELADAHTTFAAERAQLIERLDDADQTLDLVRGLVAGPRRYVLVASNNAEMRAGSGMALFAGVLTIDNGDVSISDLRSTTPASLTVGESVPLNDRDLSVNWGHTDPGGDFRNLALSPRFDLTAEVGTRFWERAVGGEVDGMLMVDPVVVSELLKVTGPVEIDGLTLNSRSAITYLLRDQYLDPRFETFDTDAQYPLIVEAILTKLTNEAFDPFKLASALQASANGRHILGWSRIDSDQKLWLQAGIDGQMSEESFAISLQNAGGNKLDYGLEVDTDIEVIRGTSSGGTEVRTTLTVANLDPTLGLPFPQVTGIDAEDGTYIGVLAVTMPAGAREIDVTGAGPIARLGPDGSNQVVTTNRFTIDAGQTAQIEIRFVVPSSLDNLVIESSARVPAITHRSGDRTAKDNRQLVLDLTQQPAVLR